MTAPAPRGWCPGLHDPMESGDGLLLRLHPPPGGLRAAEARLVAALAARHGNGVVELTQRANLQLRGFTAAGARAFADAVVAAGLAPGQAALAPMVPPLLGLDPTLHPGTADLVAELARAMAGWPALPAKFGVLVDGGGALPLAAEQADIALRLQGDHAWLDLGGVARASVAPERAVPAATLLARWFAARPGARRMRDAVLADGAAAVLAVAELRPCALPARPPAPASVGVLPLALGVAPAFGAMTATQLAGLADFAATLRPTPWRGLLLPGATDPAPATALGLITDPADPRLQIRACTGAPRCVSGLIDTRAAATAAAARGIPGLLHVSGCGKGCAHPGPAPRLLLGTARGHAVACGARAGDPPALDGLTLDAALEALA